MVGSPRYFQVGFRKCGTTSISAFFSRNGIPSVHYDDGRLGRRMQRNHRRGVPLLAGYDDRYQAFTNMEYYDSRDYFEGYRHYAEMMAAYEDARFILNTRDQERWIRSMVSYAVRPGAQKVIKEQYHRWRYGTTDMEELSDLWREEWDAHHRDVIADIPAERLLVFDIERDDPALLCRFAGLPPEGSRHYTQANPSLTPVGAALSRLVPIAAKRAVPSRIKHPVKRWLRRRQD